eukprot:12813416-Alexandrium_andersonii.AAC.1
MTSCKSVKRVLPLELPEALRNSPELSVALVGSLELSGGLWSSPGLSRALRGSPELSGEICRALRGSAEHSGALRSTDGRPHSHVGGASEFGAQPPRA